MPVSPSRKRANMAPPPILRGLTRLPQLHPSRQMFILSPARPQRCDRTLRIVFL
ncbi:hypothetical protein BD310DRAFT_937146 [Dichomitus squalens]|uniref:Uncharacterized protein n=1 Tax=Dichomitus squalens TaxID=114155 RepID=A0A4V2K6X1_9APHY|nr:hypothetical protein BD310DRAFT_937146 [Dichomitus squalens]